MFLTVVEIRLPGFGQDNYTGAAWLSSARVVRCWVKSCNERNPCCQLLLRKQGTLMGLPGKPGGRWG